jgi:hypothetical protein
MALVPVSISGVRCVHRGAGAQARMNARVCKHAQTYIRLAWRSVLAAVWEAVGARKSLCAATVAVCCDFLRGGGVTPFAVVFGVVEF